MKKHLTHIAPLKCGLVLGIVYGIMSLLVLVPMAILFTLFGAANARAGNSTPPMFTGVFMIFLPVVYAVLGFIGGIVGAFIYNLVAKWTGGLEFTTTDVPTTPDVPTTEAI